MLHSLIEKSMDVIVQTTSIDFFWLYFPLITWMLARVILKKFMKRYVTLASFFLSFSITVYTNGIGFAWLMRDGLAPGFIPSHGINAIEKFLPLFMIVVTLTIPTLAAFLLTYFKGRREN